MVLGSLSLDEVHLSAFRSRRTIMTGRPGHLFLDIFMPALPFTFGNVEGTLCGVITVVVTEEVGGLV